MSTHNKDYISFHNNEKGIKSQVLLEYHQDEQIT